jgi:hypothetical protein
MVAARVRVISHLLNVWFVLGKLKMTLLVPRRFMVVFVIGKRCLQKAMTLHVLLVPQIAP